MFTNDRHIGRTPRTALAGLVLWAWNPLVLVEVGQGPAAVQYLVQLYETLGTEWLTPDLYRLGASTLLNDLLMQRTKMRTGRYSGPDYFTLD